MCWVAGLNLIRCRTSTNEMSLMQLTNPHRVYTTTRTRQAGSEPRHHLISQPHPVKDEGDNLLLRSKGWVMRLIGMNLYSATDLSLLAVTPPLSHPGEYFG